MTEAERVSGLRGAKADPNCRLCGGRGVLMKPETRPCLCLLDSVSATMGVAPAPVIRLRDFELTEEEDDGQPDEQQEWRDACGDEDDWMSGAEQVEDAP